MRKLIKRLFRCPPDRSIILIWAVKTAGYALGQTETKYQLKIGSYTIVSWTVIFTPQSDWGK